jgi:hypothetical protein
LLEKHDSAVRFLDVSKVVCLRLRANKKTTFVAFLFAVSPEQNPNFFPKQPERGLICAPRPLPAVAGAKTKNFPYLSSFPRRGVWGEPTKNGKEIFGFASPLQTTK